MIYSIHEMIQMIEAVAQSNTNMGMGRRNIAKGRRKYAERFPNRHLPSEGTFLLVLTTLKTTGRLPMFPTHDGRIRTRSYTRAEGEP